MPICQSILDNWEKSDREYATQVANSINSGRKSARAHVEEDLANLPKETRQKIQLGINKADRFHNAVEYYGIKEHKEDNKLKQLVNFFVKSASDTSVNICAHRAVVATT